MLNFKTLIGFSHQKVLARESIEQSVFLNISIQKSTTVGSFCDLSHLFKSGIAQLNLSELCLLGKLR